MNNKGFNKHQDVMGGDDDLFVNEHAGKFNTNVAIERESLTYSYPKTSFKDFFRQKIRHLSVGTNYKFKHQIILGFYTLSYLLFWGTGLGLIFAYPLVVTIGFFGKDRHDISNVLCGFQKNRRSICAVDITCLRYCIWVLLYCHNCDDSVFKKD